MRNAAYLSSILAIVLVVIRFIGLLVDIANANLFLYAGLGLIVFVSVPLFLLDTYTYNKRKKKILKEFKKSKDDPSTSDSKAKSTLSYPSFRKQKSGLTWGGGNIHASSAKRGSKKSFLRN